jgi:IrrE N-terminal-like domain
MARTLGVGCIKRESRLPTAALLIRDEEHGMVVLVRADDPRTRQRFSLAHELGHVLVDARGLHSDLSCRDAEVERLCDRLAAELLLPRSLFKQRAGMTPLQHAMQVADRCCASRTAAARRLVDLDPELVLIAWSTRPRPGSTAKLRVLWPHKHHGVFVPAYGTPPAELGLERLARGAVARRSVGLRLGSLSGEHDVESVRLRYPNQSQDGSFAEILSLVRRPS